jgi:hypothetical protein
LALAVLLKSELGLGALLKSELGLGLALRIAEGGSGLAAYAKFPDELITARIEPVAIASIANS